MSDQILANVGVPTSASNGQLDFRVLIETFRGTKFSYFTSSYVDLNKLTTISSSEALNRISQMDSCSYYNGNLNFRNPSASGSIETSKHWTDSANPLTCSLSSLEGQPLSDTTGSLTFKQKLITDPVKRYKFVGKTVCNVLGLPESTWIYSDDFRLSTAKDESSFFRGNITADNLEVMRRVNFSNISTITSDVSFRIDTGSEAETSRQIKFVDYSLRNESNQVLPKNKIFFGHFMSSSNHQYYQLAPQWDMQNEPPIAGGNAISNKFVVEATEINIGYQTGSNNVPDPGSPTASWETLNVNGGIVGNSIITNTWNRKLSSAYGSGKIIDTVGTYTNFYGTSSALARSRMSDSGWVHNIYRLGGQEFSWNGDTMYKLFHIDGNGGRESVHVGSGSSSDTVLFNVHQSATIGGSLGIGTSSPSNLLHISSSNGDGIRLGGGSPRMEITEETDKFHFQVLGTGYADKPIQIGRDDGNHKVTIIADNIGLGTSLPTKKVTIAGDFSASGDFYMRGNEYIYFRGDDSLSGGYPNNAYIGYNGNTTQTMIAGGTGGVKIQDNLVLHSSAFISSSKEPFWEGSSNFSARMSAAETSLTANQLTKVVFDQEIFDVDSNYNTSTGTFTAPTKGIYHFNSCIGFVNQDSGLNTVILAYSSSHGSGAAKDEQLYTKWYDANEWGGNISDTENHSACFQKTLQLENNEMVNVCYWVNDNGGDIDNATTITGTSGGTGYQTWWDGHLLTAVK
tara:strand:- start:735 stop:2951 length:2217 start_codon:yes stop_codon:yes gene_type:complete